MPRPVGFTSHSCSDGNSVRARQTSDLIKSIFLPAGGAWSDTDHKYKGNSGLYWSTKYYNSNFAYTVYFYDIAISISSTFNPLIGISVRPVR